MGFLSAFFPNNEENEDEHAAKGRKSAAQMDAQLKASDEKHRLALEKMSPVQRATYEEEDKRRRRKK